ncbi:MAG: hypothetical protein U0168_04405 [Nannocystaceae bacterium]
MEPRAPQASPPVAGARGGTARYPAAPALPARTRILHMVLQLWRDAAATPPPSRDDARARFVYGLQQPLLGVRLLLRDRDLLGLALAPAALLAIVCAIAAAGSMEVRAAHGPSWWSLGLAGLEGSAMCVIAFFTTVAALAPVPPFLFARHYARLAARARNALGLGPRIPWLKSLSQSIGETVAQVVVLTFGLLPLTLPLALLGATGALVAFVAQLLWTMHWIVVESLDNGRTLAPGEDVAEVTKAELAVADTPWFARPIHGVRHERARRWLAPVRGFTEIMESLVRGWSPELRLVERESALSAGFGLGAFVLLAIPGVNLLFRPALVVAAAHLRGQLEREHALEAEAEALAAVDYAGGS